ncbi:CRTAC1 family protein [Luteitalea pratensis]|uniref:CRTAC1 family protein n=1 Tax=Luteitalea pratensis TaxID=1855912 RepID=UPI00138FD4A6|nr:CRTAC1 family protein [Luteitalea pratensis]
MTWTTPATILGFLERGIRRHAGMTGVTLLLAGVVAVPGATRQAAPASAASDDARARLGGLRRQAEDALRRADSPSTTAADRVESLRGAAASLEAIARDEAAARVLRADLVADVRRTAGALRAAVDGGVAVDTSPVKSLLDRLRTALDGDVALGLTFQGSYSQARAKEPVYGGHASAMGPAPAAGAAEATGAPSPVTFHEHAVVPTRTWDGGPAKDHILESPGNGVALVDVDGDGLLDIYLVTAAQLDASRSRIPHRNALYRNLGNWRFEDISRKAGVDAAAWGNGVCAGDADGDGRVDLYVTNWGTNLLFRNKGDGRFEDIASAAGVAAGGWSTGCTFFDADADGDLDLYVARYVSATDEDLQRARRTLRWRNGPAIMVGPAGLPGESDLFFENLGNGRFREAAAAHGLADAARAYGFGVVATDVDDDGAVDLFVANDSNPNFLYRNLGNGQFESAGLLAGVGVNAEARAQAGMGVDAGDADGDGRVDLVLTAFAHDRNTLYRNLGNATFEDASLQAGLATITFQRMGWGVAFLDADLDAQLDLFIANGHIFADVGDYPELGETFAQRNQFLLNTGGTFRDVSSTAGPGLQVMKVSRGLAVGDIDNDGDPDVVISNMDDAPTLLENRQATGHHWISLQLGTPAGNRLAIGARVTVTAAGRRLVREVRSGGSFMSQGDLRLQIGLGAHAAPVDVEVRMPGGARWAWRGLAIDRLHALALTPETRTGAQAGASR